MAEPHTSGPSPRAPRAARRRPDPARAALVLLVALAAVPLLASAVRLVPGWVPQGDDATIVLRGDDLFSSHTPLLGMPSTVGDAVDAQVHHPGPLESQAIGVVAAVVDDPRVAAAVVTLVNLASVLLVLLWAHRLGGPTLLAGAAVVVAALLWSLRGPILVTPFNPYVAVLPFLACLASLVAATERQPWAVTATVVSASWAAQAHLTTTGPVVGAVTAAAAVVALRWARPRWRGQPSPAIALDRRRVLVGAGVLLACWAFPLTDALTDGGGNVRAMLQATGSLDDETLGARGALDVVVQALAARPVWAQAGAGSLDLLATPSAVQYAMAGLLVGAASVLAVACRKRRPAITVAVILAFSSLAVGGALTARIPRSFFNLIALHNYLWLWPVGALLWVAVGAGAAHLAGGRVPRRVPQVAVTATAAVIAGILAVASLGAPHRPPATAASVYVRSVAPAVTEALDPGDRYLIDLDADIATYGIGTGLLHHLERAGYDVRVPERFEASFGAHRVDDGQDRAVLVIRVERGEPASPDPAARAIAVHRPRPELVEQRAAAERALVLEIQRRGGLTVGTGERIEPADADEWVRSGSFLSAMEFRLVDRSLRESPPARQLDALIDEPLEHVVVYLLPAG